MLSFDRQQRFLRKVLRFLELWWGETAWKHRSWQAVDSRWQNAIYHSEPPF